MAVDNCYWLGVPEGLLLYRISDRNSNIQKSRSATVFQNFHTIWGQLSNKLCANEISRNVSLRRVLTEKFKFETRFLTDIL